MIITQNNIIGYIRYVDDILVVYDEKSTDIHDVNRAFSSRAPTIKFTTKTETNNNINFFDISIRKT